MQRCVRAAFAGSPSVPVMTAALYVVTLCVAAPNARAQAVISVGPFGSHAPGDAYSRAVAGLSVGMTSGPFGARVSAGVPVALHPTTDPAAARDAWSGDADLLLLVDLLPGRSRERGPGPAVFALAGVGAASPPQLDGTSGLVGNWSYGGGVNVPFATVLELTAEGRYRRPLAAAPLASSSTPVARTEARVGLAIRLGGRSSARGSTGRRVETAPRPVPRPAPAPRAGAAAVVLPTADRYLGVPYRWGGTSPTTGFDCSGFVQFVFDKHGTRLPRTSREQATAGVPLPVSWDALSPGDLVMFAEPGARISHVAIYAGSSRIIHATASGGRVRYDDLESSRGRWFARRLVAARRVTPRGQQLVRGLLELVPQASLRDVELDPPDRAPRP